MKLSKPSGSASMPPDLDALAWTIAEEDSIAAHQEFAKRHPAYADEIARRIEWVRERREAGREIDHHAAPLPTRRAPLPFWTWILGGASLGAIALVFALPTIRRGVAETAPSPSAVAPPSPSALAASTAEPDRPAAPPETPQQIEADGDAPPVSNPVLESDGTPGPALGGDPNKPTTMRLAQTPLHTALALIAEAGRLKLRIDGDVPNPEVEANLVEKTPREMLDELGSQYGFQVSEEAPGSLVATPLPEDPAAGNS